MNANAPVQFLRTSATLFRARFIVNFQGDKVSKGPAGFQGASTKLVAIFARTSSGGTQGRLSKAFDKAAATKYPAAYFTTATHGTLTYTTAPSDSTTLQLIHAPSPPHPCLVSPRPHAWSYTLPRPRQAHYFANDPTYPPQSRSPLSDLIRACSGGGELYLLEPPSSPSLSHTSVDELSIHRRPQRASWVPDSYTKIPLSPAIPSTLLFTLIHDNDFWRPSSASSPVLAAANTDRDAQVTQHSHRFEGREFTLFHLICNRNSQDTSFDIFTASGGNCGPVGAQPRPSIPTHTASTQRRGAISVLCCSNAGSVSSAGAGPTISDALATIVADSSVRSTRALARHPSEAFNKGSSAGGSGSSRTRVANYGADTATAPASASPPVAGPSSSQSASAMMRRGTATPVPGRQP
ncbi:hypothetical protein BJ912DRAFT_1078154 [Pholiota molesta]|nr:hypothetical protein BJ912DRAFT_1078154 [Pholiota molesta]